MGEDMTMHRLSIILKIPYATFYRRINEMSSLISKKNIGKSTIISLNLKNRIISSYLAISSENVKEEHIKKNKLIEKITKELDTNSIVILFGSYAKKTETEKSDIDIIIIGEKIPFRKYELLFKKQINTVYITEKELRTMIIEKEENIGKQSLKDHIILNNPQKYWEIITDVYKTIQGNGYATEDSAV